MNVNVFFVLIGVGLTMILFLFKPLELKEQSFANVPLFELQEFTLYELNGVGLNTLMKGRSATKYADKYVVSFVDYTDNSQKYVANMKADGGIYEESVVKLEKNVVYVREDGLSFKTDKAVYDKTTNVVTSPNQYVARQGGNVLSGSSLKYDNVEDKMESRDVIVKYTLGEL